MKSHAFQIIEVIGLSVIVAGVVLLSITGGLIVAGLIIVIWSNVNAAEQNAEEHGDPRNSRRSVSSDGPENY